MDNPYRVECFKNGDFKKSRRFKTADQAIRFANDWHDSHDGVWDVQIITPSLQVHQTNRNGNTQLGSIS
jgi:hypothetical protein